MSYCSMFRAYCNFTETNQQKICEYYDKKEQTANCFTLCKRYQNQTAYQTWTRVAKSSWKKKIKISSLAFSLRSQLASDSWLPPLLKSHPASTFKFLPLNTLWLPVTNKLGTNWCRWICLSFPKALLVFLVKLKCLLHDGMEP